MEKAFGTPQDAECAYDAAGKLWLLQSRPITTLFPIPPLADPADLPVYLEAGHMQGMRALITTMGMRSLTPARPSGLSPLECGRAQMMSWLISRAACSSISPGSYEPAAPGAAAAGMKIYGAAVTKAVHRILEIRGLRRVPGEELITARWCE